MSANQDRPVRRRPAPRGGALLVLGLLVAPSLGCSAFLAGTDRPEPAIREVTVRPAAPRGGDSSPDRSDAGQDDKAENGKEKGANEKEAADKEKDADEKKKEGAGERPKPKLTLPMAVALCVSNNFRALAAAHKVGMAEGDLLTASLIPNPSLFADCQLIPLQRADLANQLGPPQWDTLVSVPIDWLLFGKRLAAVEAARLG